MDVTGRYFSPVRGNDWAIRGNRWRQMAQHRNTQQNHYPEYTGPITIE